MPELNKNKSRLLKTELIALSQLIAKKYSKPFNVKNDSAQVIPLLQFAIKSDDVVVQSYLAAIYSCISQSHKRFFEQNGIDLSSFKKAASSEPHDESDKQTMTYRGQQRLQAKPKGNNDAEEPNKGKRKIVYRGQEKWI